MSAVAQSQPELARWLAWADPMPTTDAERHFVEEHQRAFEGDEDYGYFLIERRPARTSTAVTRSSPTRKAGTTGLPGSGPQSGAHERRCPVDGASISPSASYGFGLAD